MKLPHPQVDYRRLRPGNLNTPQYRHLLLLAYWPVFGFLFWFAERVYPVKQYIVVHSWVDSLIPFCELFVLPYMLWFVYLFGIHMYTLLYDVQAFKKLMKYIIITYSAALVIYYLFPTCQLLRPVAFERDNILTQFMSAFYAFDTNTNVCPSLHVIGSMAVMYTAWNTEGLDGRKSKVIFAIATFLISISTVFLKQHSVVDILVALPICMIAYGMCFDRKDAGAPWFVKKIKEKFA